jgi:MFS family permease
MTTQKIGEILSRNFVLTFFAHFALLSIFYIFIPTLPIYLSRLGSNEEEIGILIGVFTLSSVVLRPFVGRALLKFPEKKFMMIGAVLFALTSIAYLIAPPFWPLLIVRFFQGIGFAFFHTASMTLIANISPETHRGRSLGYFNLAATISGALAPPIGIFLVNHFSFPILFLVCGGLSLCSLFITTQLRMKQFTALKNFSVEKDSLFSQKALPSSFINCFSFFIWGALTAFFPLYAVNHGMENPGLFFTTMAIMLILGRSLGGKVFDLYSKERIILPCLTICIVSMVILAFSKTLAMFILVAVIWGTGFAFLTPSLIAYTLDRVGSSPGPTMGTFTAISDLGLSFGPLIMGIVLHSTGYTIMFLCLALAGAINLNYFYFFVRKKG